MITGVLAGCFPDGLGRNERCRSLRGCPSVNTYPDPRTITKTQETNTVSCVFWFWGQLLFSLLLMLLSIPLSRGEYLGVHPDDCVFDHISIHPSYEGNIDNHI